MLLHDFILFAYVWQKCNISCSLYSHCQLTLMISACTGNTSWQNLSSVSHALSESCDILVINFFNSVSTEHTNLSKSPKSPSCIDSSTG